MSDKSTEWTKRITDGLMDDLAEDVFDMLEDMGFSESYIEDQRKALIGKNKYEILL